VPDGVTISQTTINTVGMAVLGGLLAFVSTWFWVWRAAAAKKSDARDAERDEMTKRLIELETKERIASQAISPLVTAFQSLLIQKLTHAHKPELDALMVKIGPPDILTDQERGRMLLMLEERYQEPDESIGQDERNAAKILPLVMPMAVEEQRGLAEVGGLRGFRLMTIISPVSQ
jgi:hypothetical protein